MNDYIPDARVTGYEDLIDNLKLPDLKDRHVLAVAIQSNSQVIVTNNIRHFPSDYLERYNIEAKSADDFMLDVLDLGADIVVTVLKEQSSDLKKPPMTLDDVIKNLGQFVPCSMSAIRQYIS